MVERGVATAPCVMFHVERRALVPDVGATPMTSGFLFDIWQRLQDVGATIVDDPDGYPIEIRFPSDGLAYGFMRQAHNPDVWIHPINPSWVLTQDGSVIHITR